MLLYINIIGVVTTTTKHCFLHYYSYTDSSKLTSIDFNDDNFTNINKKSIRKTLFSFIQGVYTGRVEVSRIREGSDCFKINNSKIYQYQQLNVIETTI